MRDGLKRHEAIKSVPFKWNIYYIDIIYIVQFPSEFFVRWTPSISAKNISSLKRPLRRIEKMWTTLSEIG